MNKDRYAEIFLKYLGAPEVQKIYESFTFIPATAEELKVKSF